MTFLSHPWVIIGAGIIFCITAIALFRRNVFEENRSIAGAVVIMLMGVILIGIGSAKSVGLM
jgi:hypothetical protein